MEKLVLKGNVEAGDDNENVPSESEVRMLGGEIYHQKKKNEKIIWGIIGILMFVLFNVILSFVANV
jgi:hypothetical protein